MYKSINLHKDTHQHEFASLDAAIAFFAADHKVKILKKYESVDGMTAGKETRVKECTLIGLYGKVDLDDSTALLFADVPDEVILLENQETKLHPLG